MPRNATIEPEEKQEDPLELLPEQFRDEFVPAFDADFFGPEHPREAWSWRLVEDIPRIYGLSLCGAIFCTVYLVAIVSLPFTQWGENGEAPRYNLYAFAGLLGMITVSFAVHGTCMYASCYRFTQRNEARANVLAIVVAGIFSALLFLALPSSLGADPRFYL